MESKDIIKALECCKKGACCTDCPLKNKRDCMKILFTKLLSMLCQKEATIEAQKVAIEIKQAEIEKLKAELESMGADTKKQIDMFESYEKQIKELEFINEQKDLIISKLKKENAELEERIKWYSFGRNGHLGHIDTSDLL